MLHRAERLFGLFAYPVGHSLSPEMHNRAFQALNLPYYYHPFQVAPEDLPAAVAGLKAMGIGGINVTIPHKERIMPLLDEVDREAEAIGAVNTVVLTNQRLVGYNTDGAGYVHSLLQETGINLAETEALIIGAGGAAKAIAVYLVKHGCTRLTIANRTLERAEALVDRLDQYTRWLRDEEKGPVPGESMEKRDSHPRFQVTTSAELEQGGVSQYSLIVNTTPLGMWPDVEGLPFQIKSLTPGTIVSDIVYNPLETSFLKQAKARGAVIHSGLGMFIYQGALAFEHFTGREAPLEVMKSTVLDRLIRKEQA